MHIKCMHLRGMHIRGTQLGETLNACTNIQHLLASKLHTLQTTHASGPGGRRYDIWTTAGLQRQDCFQFQGRTLRAVSVHVFVSPVNSYPVSYAEHERGRTAHAQHTKRSAEEKKGKEGVWGGDCQHTPAHASTRPSRTCCSPPPSPQCNQQQLLPRLSCRTQHQAWRLATSHHAMFRCSCVGIHRSNSDGPLHTLSCLHRRQPSDVTFPFCL